MKQSSFDIRQQQFFDLHIQNPNFAATLFVCTKFRLDGSQECPVRSNEIVNTFFFESCGYLT